jgi:hypothetical protein
VLGCSFRGQFTPTAANRAQALADAKKMLPIWEVSIFMLGSL